MKSITSSQMQELDRKATEIYGIPSLLLMENAGRSIADFICTQQQTARKALVFCGKGNNGGDGLVAGRHLWNRGWDVVIYLLADPAALKPGPLVNYQIAVKMGIPVRPVQTADDLRDAPQALKSTEIILDALLGIGTTRPLEEPYRTAVNAMNHSGKPVYAVDVPSGLNADNGTVCGAVVRASGTLTLGLPKQGLYTGEGLTAAGKITVLDIGLPRILTEAL